MSSPPVTRGAFGPQSIYQVARELKKEQHTLFNCLASILSDAAFIQEIRLLYPDQPLLANLRAGGWYAPSPDGTCYFKSTDGHQNNCNFSVTRLNWHVAELAAQKGGAIIVDATRKGKRFPDAMSKTIPIWAAVLNRAVARVRAYDANKAQRRAAVGESVTAVADTQTTISVRSEDGQAGCSDDSSAALEAATQQGVQDCSAAAASQQQPCGVSQVSSSQQQPREQVAAGQHLLHGFEQSQGQQQQHPAHLYGTQQSDPGSGHTPTLEESIQAASALDSYDCSCSTQVVQLLVDCLGPSVDLMSGLSALESSTDSAASTAAGPFNLPAALASDACTAGTCSSSSTHTVATSTASGAAPAPAAGAPAAAAAAAGLAGCLGCPKCCCLQRSKSVHISPQPSLHEWLDEMDVLRRLSFLAADSRTRRPPRVSCPSPCCCSSKAEGQPAGVSIARCESAAADCAGSAPAVSCLLSTADEDGAPATPAAAAGPHVQHVQEALPHLQGTARLGSPAASSRLGDGHRAAAAAAGHGSLSTPLPGTGSTAAAERLSSPGFQLSTGDNSFACDACDAGEPVTPRLMFGSINSSSSTRSSSGDEPLLWPLQQEIAQASGSPEEEHPPLTQLQVADAVTAEPSSSSTQGVCEADGSSGGVAHGDFAFPSQHQLAVSAGSSVGAEAAGHLAGSGVASSGGSSCGSGLVRLPDMPVVVLNGTSHQPGDAASILDIWRGTDLEDVACLPDITDFRPGVYHMPEAHQRSRQVSIDLDNRPSTQQQQQQLGRACDAGSNSNGSSSGSVSLAAEVCLRAEEQMSGRVSVSTWLEDDDACAACDALCAFAVPALPPSCASLATRSDEAGGPDDTEVEASCCSLGCGSQGSCSECSDDSRPCSRQSSSTTAGLSSSPPAGGGSASFSCSAAAAADCEGDGGPVEWDTALHLPLWVSTHEREAIEAKLDVWVERLLEVGADVRGLAAMLTKPLRPLWVSQASVIWTNQVAQPSSLPFTPLLLVSASQPQAGERQAVKSAWLALARGSGCSSSPERPLTPGLSGGLSDDSSDEDMDEEGDWDGLGLACSWGSRQGRQGLLRGSAAKQQRKHSKPAAAGRGSSRASDELGSWSYVYVPGAGDDEESWAAGLTPALFWQHCDALLRCGPSNIRPAVKQLLQLHKSTSFGGAAAASLAAAAVRGLAAAPAAGGSKTGGPVVRPMSPLGPGGSSSRGSGSSARAGSCVPAVPTDKHHLAPQGCESAGVSLHVTPAAPGAFWVGTTGLALGNLEGASAADVWRAFDAVLCCGTAMMPVLQGEYQAMRLAAARVPATPAGCVISSSAPSAGLWVQQHKQQQQQGHSSSPAKAAAGQRPLSSSFCTSDAAHSHWVRQQQQLAAAGDGAAAADQVQQSLEFSRVANGPALSRKPVRKSGMLSALLSKAGPSPAANHPAGNNANAPAEAVLDAALQQVGSDASSAAGSEAGSVCSSSYYSVSSEDGLPGSSINSSSRSALPRLKWLPVESAKRDRSSLKQHLQEALEFVSAHLAAGHNVLLHDVEGHDNCVCCVVAVLSACFAPPAAAADAAGSPGAGAGEPLFTGPWLSSCQGAAAEQQQQQHVTASLPPVLVSKQSVRQQLALVSGAYPLARPTRAMLKQVFNFFEERKRAGK